MTEYRDVSEIAKDFNVIITELIKVFKNEAPSEDIGIIELNHNRFIIFVKAMGHQMMISRAAPFFARYAKSILDDNETNRTAFLNSLNVKNICDEYCRKYSETINTADFECIDQMSTMIKRYYNEANRTTRGIIYSHIKNMTKLCLEYLITK